MRSLTLTFALLATGQAWALDKDTALTQYVHDTWGRDEGLRQHMIRGIAQGPDGYLWLATGDGLVRFDGVRFTTYDTDNVPSMLDNFALTVLPDAAGFWAGTNYGLLRLEHGKFTTYTEKDGLSDGYVSGLVQGSEGLWIGTNKGLNRLAGGRISVHPQFASGAVRVLAASADGSVWAAARGTLHRVTAGRVVSYGTREGVPADLVITGLHEAADGTLWVASEGGLGRFRDGVFRLYTTRDGLASNRIEAITAGRDGGVWAATPAGLVRFDGKRFATFGKPEGLTDESVLAVFEDREGSLWIGTETSGLNRLRDGAFKAYGKPEGVSSSELWCVLTTSDGSLWMGTKKDGLSRLSGGRVSVYTTRDGLPHDDVLALWEGRDGSVWIGTRGGLARWTAGRIRPVPVRAAGTMLIYMVIEDSKGRVWVAGGSAGLFRGDGAAFVAVPPPESVGSERTPVLAVLETRDGAVWAAARSGVWRYRDGEAATAYTPRDGLGGERVHALHETADGTLWASSSPGGLSRFSNGRWTAVPRSSGLPHDGAYTLMEDGLGNVWLSADRGIYSLPLAELSAAFTGRPVALRSYDTRDGVRVTEANAGQPAGWRSADGRLWFATSGGAAVVDPRNLRRNTVPPGVYIEAVRADDAPVALASTPQIPPGRGGLDFEYTATSLRVPERVRFKYRLEGFDADWIDAGTRRAAHYTNLPPGRYQFRVMASNDDGVWNETGAAQSLQLLPRFHQTRWFFGLWVVGLAASVWGVHRLRVRALRRREQELKRRVDESVAQIKVLRGMLPICASCKKVRNDTGYWDVIESYIQVHSHAEFSHSICPECMERLYPDYHAAQTGKG